MNATFRQLQLFLAVAEHRGVTAAARACHVTQPTVSMQLKDLSVAVGMPLFEQVGKQMYLTAAGEALAEATRAMLKEWSAFEQEVAAMKGLTRGRLRIAVVSTAKYFVPRILGSFAKKHPDIEIALELLNRDRVVARLRADQDDLYIMSVPPTDIDIVSHAFLPNPLLIVAAKHHPLATRKKILLSELKQERFILRERGSGTRLAGDRQFAKLKFTPRIRLELGSNEAIKQSVAGEMGLGVISQHALSAHPRQESLAVLPVTGFPIQASWWTIYRKGKRLSPIASAFLVHLEEAARVLRAAAKS